MRIAIGTIKSALPERTRPEAYISNKHYTPALDGLRTLAVAMVVLCHLSYRALPGGRIGVDIFFVLSGFLITGVLLREQSEYGRINLARFYTRRVIRLMPALALMVVCALAFSIMFGGIKSNDWSGAGFALLYVMDFVRAFSSYSELSPVGHTWSLAVEEHFYLIWPLALGLVATKPVRKRPVIILALALAFIVWRAILVYSGASPDRVYYAFDVRFDQLLAGCLLASVLSCSPPARVLSRIASFWPFALGGLVLIGIVGDGGGKSPIASAFLPVLVSLFSCIIILELVHRKEGLIARIASTRPMVEFGKLSYSIYLWHYPILVDVRSYTDSKLAAAAAVASSVVVAALSYYFVEKPFLRLKRRFEPSAADRAPLPDADPKLTADAAPVVNIM